MKRLWLVFVICGLLAPSWRADAQGSRTVVRMATLAPEGSIWDKNLRRMASEWTAASGGRIRVTIFPGGALGDETEIIRRLRFNNPQAAALTVVGLSRIDDAFSVFSMPFFFESYDELYAVLQRMRPTLSERLDRQNLVFIAWANTGWAHVFTTRPIRTVAELKQIKLFTSAGDDRMVQWYKTNGFQPRALAMTDILTGLTSGMIEGLPAPPTVANAFQWFRQTKYMLDLGIAPVIGAVVMTKKTWQAIPEADRGRLLEAAKTMESRLEVEIPGQDHASVEEMKKRGLVVIAADDPEWRTIGQTFATSMRGVMVPADIYDQAVRERDAYRRTTQTKP
jgi:TRAP-type transport system periplasmic protein